MQIHFSLRCLDDGRELSKDQGVTIKAVELTTAPSGVAMLIRPLIDPAGTVAVI